MLTHERYIMNENHKKIWQATQKIPEGYVVSYGQIADLAGLPGKARLAGKALGNIPDDGWRGCAVPWHRVINSQGKISLPIGSEGYQVQRERLMSEGVAVVGNKVKMATYQWQPHISEILFLFDDAFE